VGVGICIDGFDHWRYSLLKPDKIFTYAGTTRDVMPQCFRTIDIQVIAIPEEYHPISAHGAVHVIAKEFLWMNHLHGTVPFGYN
jgi:hypothetical protein